MTRRPKVTVVIPSWNGKQHLEVCLAALRRQKAPGIDWEVRVLDNGSDDGTAEWMRASHPEVPLTESPKNLGFCAANNRLVAESDGELIAFLNNDTRPQVDWLSSLVAGLLSAPPDVVAVAGKILDWGGERLDFGRGVMVFDGHAFQLDYHRPLAGARVPEPGGELPFACGANMLIRRKAFLSAGGFDEEYFAYLEDVDLGWRLWSHGGRILSVPEAVVHHRSAATGSRLGNARRGSLIERNAFWTAYKNYEDGLLEEILPAILMTLENREKTLLAGDRTSGDGSSRSAVGALAETFAKVRRHGFGESVRRGLAKLRRAIGHGASSSASSDQAKAQQLAHQQILSGLEAVTERRRAVQAGRVRSDREYFERFPVYLVPTYPGDDDLFAGPAFQSLWPAELPVVRATLDEIMAPEPAPEA